jgi:DNA-binding GntR family transcriptional regulator
VREALRHLEAEGLVTVLPNRGPVVSEVSQEEAEEIYQVRAVLEGLAGRLFAENDDPAALEELRACLEVLHKATELGDPSRALAAKDAFYKWLLTGSRNSIVASTLQSLHGRISLLRATSMSKPGRLEEAYREMAAIFHAIEERNPQEAERLCARHVRNASKAAWSQLGTDKRVKRFSA